MLPNLRETAAGNCAQQSWVCDPWTNPYRGPAALILMRFDPITTLFYELKQKIAKAAKV